jgi:hypothetical protein
MSCHLQFREIEKLGHTVKLMSRSSSPATGAAKNPKNSAALGSGLVNLF